ncbi:MAG: aldo/keto reductase [Promethearchaeota archaeon]
MKNININTNIELTNGVKMPKFGFGTYRVAPGKETYNSVSHALKIGYRLIDTAAFYQNEIDVGKAIKDSGILRDEIFVTTKLWNSDHGYHSTLKAFDKSLKKLNFSYIDLYLIHWPVKDLRLDSWRALKEILKHEKCRAIGVSNYTIKHIKEIFDSDDLIPAVNQVEFSPYTYQKALLDFLKSKNIELEAYSPLTKGYKLNDPKLLEIASKYSKTSAQILLRWALQKDVIVISKSSHPERIEENSNVFDFNISSGDMSTLDNFDENLRTGWDPTSMSL